MYNIHTYVVNTCSFVIVAYACIITVVMILFTLLLTCNESTLMWIDYYGIFIRASNLCKMLLLRLPSYFIETRSNRNKASKFICIRIPLKQYLLMKRKQFETEVTIQFQKQQPCSNYNKTVCLLNEKSSSSS